MRAADQLWHRRQRRRRFLSWAVILAVAFVAIGVPAIYFGAKVSNREAVRARTEAATQSYENFDATVARDVDAVMRHSGLCQIGCATHDPATMRWQWQIATDDGALLADLYAWPARQQGPESYRLIIYGLSPQADGGLRAGSPIVHTLVALLERFSYPDAATPFVTRDQNSGNSRYRTSGPQRVTLLWQPFPGKDRMRAQWMFNTLRTGPFTEEGSWRAER